MSPAVETLRFSFPNCPSKPPIVETREKPEDIILDLTRSTTMLSLVIEGNGAPSVETNNLQPKTPPREETSHATE